MKDSFSYHWLDNSILGSVGPLVIETTKNRLPVELACDHESFLSDSFFGSTMSLQVMSGESKAVTRLTTSSRMKTASVTLRHNK